MWWDTPEDPDRFGRAVRTTHTSTARVEVWSAGVPVAESAPFLDGSVTDEWVTGSRRSLTLTVPATRAWLRWLDIQATPALELRVFRGIRFSRALTVECPMGVFPVLPPDQPIPGGPPIQITASDSWIKVGYGDFTTPELPPTRVATDIIRALIMGAGLPEPTMLLSSPAIFATTSVDSSAPPIIQLYAGTRKQALEDAVAAAAGEAYIARDGTPMVTPVRQLEAATSEAVISTGSAFGATVATDWSKVYNVVAARSTATDVSFPPQLAYVISTDHPAHPNNTGWTRTYALKSADLRTAEAASAAAWAMLPKVAGPAQKITYRCNPDPRRDAGDSILGDTADGPRTNQIHSLDTPLRKGLQMVTVMNTRLAAAA